MRKIGRRTVLRRGMYRREGRLASPLSWDRQEKWRRGLEATCGLLAASCGDRASEVRLAHLRRRLQSHDRGAVESASAELEVAMLLLRSGAQVAFLPEARARTADLECIAGADRFFVEVTAMVGRRRRLDRAALHVVGKRDDDDVPEPLTSRVIARVSQKAKQLRDYCAPVLLAITHPPIERDDGWFRGVRVARRAVEEVDLKRLAGTLTLFLGMIPHVSAVLLSLWDLHSSRQRSGVRLANVHIVERPHGRREQPPLRLLVVNPNARYRFNEAMLASLKGRL